MKISVLSAILIISVALFSVAGPAELQVGITETVTIRLQSGTARGMQAAFQQKAGLAGTIWRW